MTQKQTKSIYDLLIWKRTKPKEEFNGEEGVELIELPPINNQVVRAILLRAENPLPGNPVVVVAHGNGEIQFDYIFGRRISPTENFCEHGISVCSFDYRGYGLSDGEYGASALTEKEDTIALIQCLKSQGFEKISYFGRSHGAACGIFAAAEFPDLVCVALDSPWISTRDWIEYCAKHFYDIDKDLFHSLLPKAYETIKNDTGLDFTTAESPEDVAHKIVSPIYVIHGTYDEIIPISHSERLMELIQSTEKHFLTIPMNHNDDARFCKPYQNLIEFIQKHNGVNLEATQ